MRATPMTAAMAMNRRMGRYSRRKPFIARSFGPWHAAEWRQFGKQNTGTARENREEIRPISQVQYHMRPQTRNARLEQDSSVKERPFRRSFGEEMAGATGLEP